MERLPDHEPGQIDSVDHVREFLSQPNAHRSHTQKHQQECHQYGIFTRRRFDPTQQQSSCRK
jgi:hypothetical protein